MLRNSDLIETNRKLLAFMSLLAVALNIFVLFPAVAMFEGFTLYKLWGWYITPTFNVAQPSIVICVGILITASLFYMLPPSYKDLKTDNSVSTSIGRTIGYGLRAGAILLAGWLLTFALDTQLFQ